jgi:hypothetical protein
MHGRPDLDGTRVGPRLGAGRLACFGHDHAKQRGLARTVGADDTDDAGLWQREGEIVDEQAVADALNRGALAGAALDVLSVEPPQANNPLLEAKNCLVTPHIAWATRAARARLMDLAVDNIRAFLAGTPRNVVNP